MTINEVITLKTALDAELIAKEARLAADSARAVAEWSGYAEIISELSDKLEIPYKVLKSTRFQYGRDHSYYGIEVSNGVISYWHHIGGYGGTNTKFVSREEFEKTFTAFLASNLVD